MRKIWLSILALGVAALPSFAQEKEAEQEKAARDERPHIQVLKHPYDISSFYRSPGGARGFSYGFGASDPYGLYGNDAGVPPSWFRPDMRRRSLDWASEFGDGRWRWDDRSNRWTFDRRRSDSRAPRPAPSRP